jgi:predicted dehydrogenase
MHNIDVGNWVMGSHPLRAYGLGGRQALGDKTGHIWDHFAVEYEYANGARMYSQARQISGTDGRVVEAVDGTKGTSNPSATIQPTGGTRWSAAPKFVNPYVQEHVDLMTAIRSGKTVNEAQTVAESTLTAIMGRESAYCGQTIEWDEVLNSKTVLMPEKLEWGPAPKWEVAMPGQHKLV